MASHPSRREGILQGFHAEIPLASLNGSPPSQAGVWRAKASLAYESLERTSIEVRSLHSGESQDRSPIV